jgi:hypothetical protein
VRIVGAVVFALVLVLLAGLGLGWGWVTFGVPVPAAVGAAYLMRRGAVTSAIVAAAAGFAMVVGYAALYYALSGPPDRSADPDCDGFCLTRAEGWLWLLAIASFIGFWVAVASGILAALISLGVKRAPVAR